MLCCLYTFVIATTRLRQTQPRLWKLAWGGGTATAKNINKRKKRIKLLLLNAVQSHLVEKNNKNEEPGTYLVLLAELFILEHR